MKKLLIVLAIFAMFIGCASGGDQINDALQQSAVSSASYLICKNNPSAIPEVKAICIAPQDQLADQIAKLLQGYDTVIEDPFLKMQADIILKAFMDQYGIDLLSPDFDFSQLDLDEIQPFVDAVCSGAVAAELAVSQ
jgi:hypothetical protein